MARITGGEKVAKALADIVARLSKADSLQVGFLGGATYPDGTLVAAVATFQEFGTPNASAPIPPRPFFRKMIAKDSPGWPKAFATIAKANGYDADRTLALMGEGIKGQLQQSIRDTNSPPLAASTIRAKGFSKPLIETSVMINSVDYEVS